MYCLMRSITGWVFMLVVIELTLVLERGWIYTIPCLSSPVDRYDLLIVQCGKHAISSCHCASLSVSTCINGHCEGAATWT